MTKYFNASEAALRYNKYRPRVHSIIIEWLNKHFENRKFRNAIDIACGTGDSLAPLSNISHYSLGIDGSEEMLIHARKKGLNVINCQYNQINIDIKFDLITTCMAFHWFETDKAISEYKRISSEDSIWLIYNFGLNGHEDSDVFNNWLFKNYYIKYPSPKQHKHSAVIPPNTHNVTKIGYGKGIIPIQLDIEHLIGYLTTQSNIEDVVQNGRTYEQVESELHSQLKDISLTPKFQYRYSYELYKYNSAQQGDAPALATDAVSASQPSIPPAR